MNSPPKYNALSLFSGAGGMDIGVQDAGFDILAQIEIDEHCCNTLRAAREREKRDSKIVESDITKYLRLHRDRPANTLRCGEIFYHPIEDRSLTPREYMRIHGYPDSYLLKGPIRSRTGTVKNLDQHRQVANSVLPPLAKALASKIFECLNLAISAMLDTLRGGLCRQALDLRGANPATYRRPR